METTSTAIQSYEKQLSDAYDTIIALQKEAITCETLAKIAAIEQKLFRDQPRGRTQLNLLPKVVTVRHGVATRILGQIRDLYYSKFALSPLPIHHFSPRFTEGIHPQKECHYSPEEVTTHNAHFQVLVRYMEAERWLYQSLEIIPNTEWMRRLNYINQALERTLGYFDDTVSFPFRQSHCVIRKTQKPIWLDRDSGSAKAAKHLFPDELPHEAVNLLEKLKPYANSYKRLEASGQLTEEEKKSFHRHFWVPCPPDEVPVKMFALFDRIKVRLEKNGDPLSIAADWHMGAYNIWPWEKRNKSTIRVWMAIMLLQKGYEPPVFESTRQYEADLLADQVLPGTFEYKQLRHPKSTDQPLSQREQ